MKHLYFCFAFLLALAAGFPVKSQIAFSRLESIPVARSGQNLALPWAGGQHAPQYSRIDLNGDGIKDLVVFDRGDNTVLPFLNNGSNVPGQAYTYAPIYARAFPGSIMHWMLLRDYNCDGKEDLFTGNANEGVTVYLNTSVGGNLAFTLAHPGLTTGTGFQIEVPATDIPAITDLDDDGDLDILSFDFAGSHVVWYRNDQSCGISNFSIGSLCWGQFAENAFNSNITLGVSCRMGLPGIPEPKSQHSLHAGSTLLVFDANGDGHKDALIGDISSNQMVFLQNSASGAMVSQTQSYPPSSPAELYIFPAAYLLDVDNDNLADLLVAPNNGSDPGGKNFEQILHYRNTGTNSSPVFSYQGNNFLSDQMLEFGSGSAPAFFDYDGDGNLDLVVGNFGYRTNPTTLSARLALLRNNGTNASPAYELIDTDYLNLSSLPIPFLTDLAPAFGDLDGDGDMDLLIGKNDGRLMYFQNTAQAGQPAAFTFVTDNYQGINVGLLSKPQIIDLNRDNLPDLVIGERNGNLNYYRNTGTASNPVFSLETDSLGKINLFAANFGAANAAPCIADFDSNGQYDLLVGDRLGRIHVYPDIENDLTGTFTEAGNTFYEPTLHLLDSLRYGQRATPAAADLTGDGKPDLIVGTFRGGLRAYQNMTGMVGLPGPAGIPGLLVWPNPTQGQLHFSVPNSQPLAVRAYTLLGQEVALPETQPNAGTGVLDLSHLPAGMYAVQFAAADGRSEVKRVVKQ